MQCSNANNPPCCRRRACGQVAEVVNRPLREWEEFSGRLKQSAACNPPRVSGFIDSAQFTEGSRVKKGKLLFRIDPRPFQAEVTVLPRN